MSLSGAAAAHPMRKAFGFNKRYLDRTIRLSQVQFIQMHDRCCYESEGKSTDDGHMLLYMLSGNAVVTIAGSTLQLPHRHLLWVKPSTSFHIIASGKSSEAIRFVTVELSPLTDNQRLTAVFKARKDHQAICDSAGLDEIFFELLKELQYQDAYTQAVLDSLINRLIVLASRLLESADSRSTRIENVLNKKELIYQTLQYIDQHIEKIDELSQVAQELGYSYSYLSQSFRAEMGLPLQAYWVQRRMMRAMNRLQSGGSSITQISEDLHYQSIHSFSKAFKKVTGFTPSEYQNLYGKGWVDV